MDEIGWDDEQHYLAEAEAESGARVVMLSQSGDFIRCIQPQNAGDAVIRLPKKDLTPNGERYELHRATVSCNENVADDQPKHPAFLRTEDEYEGAPVGTIVGDYLAPAPGKTEVLWQKLEDGLWWLVGGEHHARMPGEARPVIRWGGGYSKF